MVQDFVMWLAGLDALSWAVLLALFLVPRHLHVVKTQPYVRCRLCEGTGVRGDIRSWGPCNRCGGEGRVVRWGSRRPRPDRSLGVSAHPRR